MLSIFSLNFIFSIKAFVYICIIGILCWLLKDYPAWKASKQVHEKGTDINQKSSEEKPVHKDSVKHDNDEKLSLTHYILVSPFAAIYIVGRACVDIVRYGLYYAIYYGEKAIPHIDDWLFEFVTVSIPKRYNQAEAWWVNEGKPASIRLKNHVQQSILPNVIHYTELLFVGLYKIGCAIQSMVIEIIAAWKRFIERHDWEQLAQDLSDIAYLRVWVPATKCYELLKLAYIGTRSVLVSIASDIRWICTVIIPNIFNYIASTKIAHYSYLGMIRSVDILKRVCLGVHEYLLAPTIGRVLTWTIQCIDKLILLLEQHTIHEKLAKVYSMVAPLLVWWLVEVSGYVDAAVLGSRQLYQEILYPTYQLFKRRVLPHLTVAYEKMMTYITNCIYPAWQKIYPYLNRPVYLCYIHIMLPVYSQVQAMLSAMTHWITPELMWSIYARVNEQLRTYAWIVYSFTQDWLIRQAPVLSKMIQNSYGFIVRAFDWNGLYSELQAALSELYNWVSKHSNLIYLSFERSLSAWVQEQQDDTKIKTM